MESFYTAEPTAAWFEPKGQRSDEEPATPEEAQALQDYLIGGNTASLAARQIMMVDENCPPPYNKMHPVAWLLVDALLDFPSCHVKIIELVEAIHHIPDDEMPLSDEQKTLFPDWQKWKEFDQLTTLFDDMRRCKYCVRISTLTSSGTAKPTRSLKASWAYRTQPDEDDTDPKQCCRKWASVNAFIAMDCVCHGAKSSDYDLQYGVSVICKCLEQRLQEPKVEEGMLDKDGRWPALEADIPAAAQWLRICGSHVYGCIDNAAFTLQLLPTSFWPDETKRLSRKRWDLWKAQLSIFQQEHGLSLATRRLATEALENMLNIEQSQNGDSNISI